MAKANSGRPRPPAKLGAKARGLWSDTVGVYELSPHEVVLLESACREIDVIERLEESLDGASLIVAGSMGQNVAHPLLAEIRHHRTALAGIIRTLRLPDASAPPESAVSAAARAAVNVRWSRERFRRASEGSPQ